MCKCHAYMYNWFWFFFYEVHVVLKNSSSVKTTLALIVLVVYWVNGLYDSTFASTERIFLFCFTISIFDCYKMMGLSVIETPTFFAIHAWRHYFLNKSCNENTSACTNQDIGNDFDGYKHQSFICQNPGFCSYDIRIHFVIGFGFFLSWLFYD